MIETKLKLFPIARYIGFEEILDPLVALITGAEQAKHHTGCSYEDEIFAIRPHYMGTCTCSYKKQLAEFLSVNPHKSDCFHVELKILNDAYQKHNNYCHSNILKAERANEERKLCKAHRIRFSDGKGLDDVCNCGAIEKFSLLNHMHEENCKTKLPNFHFKPEDIQIKWYKLYFRDATCNISLSKEKFQECINICSKSVRQKK